MRIFFLLSLLYFGCAKKQRVISLEDLLPQQIASVPIGMSLSDFQNSNKQDFEVINLGPSITYLKQPITSPDLNFIQYQFQNQVLKEVLIGYKASFGAKDIAIALYGEPNAEGRWLATSNQKSVVIEIIDNAIVYR